MRDHLARRQRADLVLVARGFAPSREKARYLIKQGAVSLGGEKLVKAGQLVPEQGVFEVDNTPLKWVSRGGRKLEAAFEKMDIPSFAGCICLDLGASTGGFTDLLLARQVGHVYAVDVGHGQLASRLCSHHHVTNLEKTDARNLDSQLIPLPVDLVVCDLSFISVTKALAPALLLVRPGGWLITMIKPQFEAGRQALGKGGIVRSQQDRERSIEIVKDYLAQICGWQVRHIITSPITGSDGNIEYVMSAQKVMTPPLG